jgi:hypothetical protein
MSSTIPSYTPETAQFRVEERRIQLIAVMQDLPEEERFFCTDIVNRLANGILETLNEPNIHAPPNFNAQQFEAEWLPRLGDVAQRCYNNAKQKLQLKSEEIDLTLNAYKYSQPLQQKNDVVENSLLQKLLQKEKVPAAALTIGTSAGFGGTMGNIVPGFLADKARDQATSVAMEAEKTTAAALKAWMPAWRLYAELPDTAPERIRQLVDQNLSGSTRMSTIINTSVQALKEDATNAAARAAVANSAKRKAVTTAIGTAAGAAVGAGLIALDVLFSAEDAH